MRKKQVLALLLAGCMTLGSVPVLAAGTDAVQSAEVSSENTETIDTLQGTETPTPAETETPDSTEALTGDTDEGEETTPTPEATPTESATPTPTVTETPAAEEGSVLVGDKAYDSIAEAIQDNSSQSSLTIELKEDQTLDQKLEIPAGMTVTLTAATNVKISRGTSATKASFKVNEGAALKLSVADGGTITVNGTEKSDAPLFEVDGSLEISSGVTIQNNHSTGTAGAIYNKGTLTMTGGTIKNNSNRTAGAVNNTGTFKVSGSVVISDNYKDTDKNAKSNIVLSDQSVVTLAGKLSSSARLGIQAVNAKAGQTVVKAGSGVSLSDSLAAFTYEGSDTLQIGEDGTLTEVPQKDTTAPTLTEVSVERISDEIALVTFRSDEAGRYYVSLDDPDVDISGEGMRLRENMDVEYQVEGMTAGEHTLFIVAKDTSDNYSTVLNVVIPAAAEEIQVANPDDNTINGIASSYNRSYYDANAQAYKYFVSFSATGAGMDYPDKEGNVRYEPISWGIGDLKNQTFREGYRGSFSGAVKPGTYQLEVVFQQQEYNGTEWVATGETDTKTVDIVLNDAGPTTSPTVTTTPRSRSGSGTGGSGSGSGTGTNKTSSVSTGDTTNAVPMVLLGGSAAALAAVTVAMKKKRGEQE